MIWHSDFFGYPTLYGLDSTTHEKFTHILGAKRLKRKYRFMKNEYDVYRKLEEIYWREYPCVAVNLNDTDSTIFIFVNIDDYHKVIVKNQEQLNKDSLKVELQLSAAEIIPGYFQLLELENVEFVSNPEIRLGGNKFADMDYAW